MMKYFYVKLVRMKQKAVTIEPADEEIKLFSSMEAVETWLVNNGFVYGQRKFFNYPTDDKEWFHIDDIALEYIDVFITEMNINDFAESKYKNLKEIHMKGLPKFFK